MGRGHLAALGEKQPFLGYPVHRGRDNSSSTLEAESIFEKKYIAIGFIFPVLFHPNR